MSLQACADLVARGDPDRFAATMAAPVAARQALFPIYAANLEVARAPWLTEEPMIAEMRLQWWRDALEEIGQGGPVRRHEVTTPLADVLDAEGAQLLDAAVAARRWDVYKEPFADEAAFAEYLDVTSGNLAWAAARALGARSDAEAIVRNHAWGAGLANWFLAIPELEARGRMPLVDGRAGAVQVLARQGLDRIRQARRSRHGLATIAAPALYSGWQASALLTQVVRDPARVATGALGVSEARKRAGVLWVGVTGRW